MNFEFLLRVRRSNFGGGALRPVKLKRSRFELRHHLMVLLGEPFMKLFGQRFSLRGAARQVLVAAAAFVDHAASHVHHCVEEGMRGAAVLRRGRYVELELLGEGFLRGQVRGIAGALTEVGLGRQPPAWAGLLLAARDRAQAPRTAPARGLTLVEVLYDDPVL